MKIKSLELKDYCGYRQSSFDFDRQFSCLYGPNGCGKTTALNVIMTLCSSLDYGDPASDPMAAMRVKMALAPYIRDGCVSFRVKGVFEHEGKDYEVVFTDKGFEKNELIKSVFWWPGLVYFAKFDQDTRVFCLPEDRWAAFKLCYEAIFGYRVEPDYYTLTDPKTKSKEIIATGFYLYKPHGKISFERASAGEKKVAKSLSQIVNLPAQRLPHVVLVDNLEMHVYYQRHLIMFDTIKKMFAKMQVIATSHSTIIVEKYEPKTDLINVEDILMGGTNGI